MTSNQTGRLMLLDTASMYFRAFFGVPDTVRAPDGTPVNAVRGLLDFITRMVDEYEPTHLACCWDNDWRPQWRVELILLSDSFRSTVAGIVQVLVRDVYDERRGRLKLVPTVGSDEVPLSDPESSRNHWPRDWRAGSSLSCAQVPM